MRVLALVVLWSGAAFAQNTFPTPGGQTVQGIVSMCIVGGKAVPCTVSTTTTTTDALDRVLADLDILRVEIQRLKACIAAGTPC